MDALVKRYKYFVLQLAQMDHSQKNLAFNFQLEKSIYFFKIQAYAAYA